MTKKHTEKTNLEAMPATALTDIVALDHSLSAMARNSDQSRRFWDFVESNYIISHEQFKHLINWSTTSFSSFGHTINGYNTTNTNMPV